MSVETSSLPRPDAPGAGSRSAAVEEPESGVEPVEARPRWLPKWVDVLAIVGVVAVGIGTRFVARSALWLDEALTVNIAKLPAGQIGPWLRHDGHPPLFYWLLHYWMKVFGSSDMAVRALSGVFGLALLPLMWLIGNRLAGRRGAWTTLLITAVSPFAVRYSTETRMYSLVMLLVACGWLLLPDTLRQPRWWRLVGVTVITAMLLWSHYWSIYLICAVGIMLVARLVRDYRAGDRPGTRTTAKVIGAMGVGCALFLPWVPTMLYQSKNTGTPWAKPFVPTTLLSTSFTDIGGGEHGYTMLLGWLLLMIALIGVFGRGINARRINLDLTTQRAARPPAFVIALTVGIGSVATYASSAGFASRYDAVWVPFFLALAALGLVQFLGPLTYRLVLALFLVLGLAGSGYTALTHTRTQARTAAQAIVAHGRAGDVVVTCPDQLGPSLSRELPTGRFVIGTYPRFAPPEKVDWVNYKARLAKASPDRFAQEVLQRAGNHGIFLAWSSGYITHKTSCAALHTALVRARPWGVELLTSDSTFYENEALDWFPAQPPPSNAGPSASGTTGSSTNH